MPRSKWTKKQRATVGRFVRSKPRTVAEVYYTLEKKGCISNLTTDDIRAFLNKNYSLKGKKRCSRSHRLVQCWVERPLEVLWNVGSYDGSNRPTIESARKYD